MKQFKFLLLITCGALTLSSCYRAPNESVFYEDLDMVTTQYTSADYLNETKYKTYLIADTFAVASNVEDFDVDEVNRQIGPTVKKALFKNMGLFGYDQFDTSKLATDTPDIYIPVSITYINTKGVSYYPIYGGYSGWGWGGYPSYGYGGYYYYYPTYVPTYYEYDQGSIHIDWMDLETAKQIAGDTIWYVENMWNMTVSGLMRNATDADRNARLEAAIDQGFKQSPYLNRNQ